MNPKVLERLGIKQFNAADDLRSDKDCAIYLQACIDASPDDAALHSQALSDIRAFQATRLQSTLSETADRAAQSGMSPDLLKGLLRDES